MNKIMRRTMALAALLSLTLGSQADDKVAVVTKKGKTTYAIENVARIAIGNDLSVVTSDGKTTTYAFDDVQRIVIGDDATAISSVAQDGSATLTLAVASDGSSMTVGGWQEGQTATLELFDVAGRAVMRQAAWHGETVDISSLPSGVYVLHIGSHTAKFRK